jgi:hypothetical protein
MRAIGAAVSTSRGGTSTHRRVDDRSDREPERRERRERSRQQAQVETAKASAEEQTAAREEARRREGEAREALHWQPMRHLEVDPSARPELDTPAARYGVTARLARRAPPPTGPRARDVAREQVRDAFGHLADAGHAMAAAFRAWRAKDDDALTANAERVAPTLREAGRSALAVARTLAAAARARVEAALAARRRA